MEGRERVLFDEEAAVDELAKDTFWDKTLICNRLFEISEGERIAQKPT